MARQWERLDRKANPRGKTTPQVSIQKRGQLMLNAPAFNALGQPTAVELLFDREEQTIGMRQVDPEETRTKRELRGLRNSAIL